MENTTLLKPTLHVEVLLKSKVSVEVSQTIAKDIRACIIARCTSVEVNEKIDGYGWFCLIKKIDLPIDPPQKTQSTAL